MNAHWLLAVGFAGMAVAIFFLGWSARIMRVEWRDDKALRAAEARYERHTHRKGDPLPAGLVELPHSGRLAVEPEPWLFAGGWDQGPVADVGEYELLRQSIAQLPDDEDGLAIKATMEQPVSVTGEPPIDTGELLAITDRVEAWIAQWTAQGNVDRHTIQASDG